MDDKLYRGQGPLMWEEKLANGTYGPIQDLGSVSAATFSPTAEELKHRESRSGKRAVDNVIETTTDCAVSLTVDNFSQDSLGLHLRSDVTSVAAGSVVNQVIGDVADIAVGDIFRIPFLKIEDLVIVDSTVAPVTLVEGTHYEAVSAAHGYYRLLNKTGLTGDLKASFDHAGKKSIKAMSKKKVTGRLSFLGINTAAENEPQLVQAIVTLTAANSFTLINDEYGTFEVTGECLFTNGGFFTVDGVPAV